MKKIIQICLVTMCLLMLQPCSSYFCFAKQSEQISYLIAQSYLPQAESYGIENDEIKSSSRPIDVQAKQMMVGQSISPKTDEKNQIDRTYSVANILIANTQSLYMYMYFSDSNDFHNLSITLLSGEKSLSWFVDSDVLARQVFQSSNTSKLRFGWLLVELPVSCATQNGDLDSVSKITIKYSSAESDKNDYAKLTIYAPYLAKSKNADISFSDKQNYYNISVNWGDNIDKYCLGDSYAIDSWNDIFDYCVIGDLDLLKYSTSLYRFVLDIIDKNGKIQSKNVFSGTFSAKFDTAGTYTLRITLYDSNGTWLWQIPDRQVEIKEFVALYLDSDFNNLLPDKEYVFDIHINELVDQFNSIQVESSNDAVAEAYISGDKLIIKTKKVGNAKVDIKINALRANAEEQTYSYNYNVIINKTDGFSWLTIILGSISLIIISILVYIIMVKRRLIPGKYPKY